jgi:hypothetical protein
MKEFKTDNLSLCPYLKMNGLKFLRTELGIGRQDRPIVLFVFEDPLGQGIDLQLDYMKSDFKSYRDLLFFFRNEIDKITKRLEKLNKEDSQSKYEE